MNNLYLRSNMDPIQVTTILVAPLSFIHLKTLQTVFSSFFNLMQDNVMLRCIVGKPYVSLKRIVV